MTRIILIISFIFSSIASYSQISTPTKRPFNLGIFSGVGGINFTPIPGVDLHYKGTLLRVAPGYKVNSVGLIREIMPLSEVFYNWYWIGSIYGAKGYDKDIYGSSLGHSLRSNYYKGILLTGAKVYFSKRWYSQLQAGVCYTKFKTDGYPSDEDITPYFEFTLGINLYKSYTNEEDFQ